MPPKDTPAPSSRRTAPSSGRAAPSSRKRAPASGEAQPPSRRGGSSRDSRVRGRNESMADARRLLLREQMRALPLRAVYRVSELAQAAHISRFRMLRLLEEQDVD